MLCSSRLCSHGCSPVADTLLRFIVAFTIIAVGRCVFVCFYIVVSVFVFITLTVSYKPHFPQTLFFYVHNLKPINCLRLKFLKWILHKTFHLLSSNTFFTNNLFVTTTYTVLLFCTLIVNIPILPIASNWTY